MNEQRLKDISIVPWKRYLKITMESVLSFYVATFCVLMFYFHKGINWQLPGIILLALYAFVIFACVKRIKDQLSMAALMLVIPIAPLLALIIVVTFIPIMQLFK